MRVLLVSPQFHGYWRAISASLEARGHVVSAIPYDEHLSLGSRGWHHLRHELPRRLRLGSHRGLMRSHTARAVRAVREARPQVVLIVKGDTLGEPFWDLLDQVRLPRIIWLYDEVRRTRWNVARLAHVGPVATYSPYDDELFRSSGVNTRWLPLAFDHRLVEPRAGAPNGEVVFVGARYPERERLLTMLTQNGVDVRAFGRDWSRHPTDRARTWDWHRPKLSSGRELGRVDAYRTMGTASATLNIHGDQDGFTMRTFEASGMGGLQLIDRSDVEALYSLGSELVTWTSDDDLVEVCNRAVADRAWSDGIRTAGRRRTLAEHTFDHRVRVLEDAWDTA